MTRQASPFGVCVSVPSHGAADAIQRLCEAGLRDDRYRVLQEDERVLIPVEHPQQALDRCEQARLVEAKLEPDPRRPPIELVRERLRARIGDEELSKLPTGWSRLGDVLVLRMPEALEAHEEAIARAFADVLDVRSVLHLEGSTGAWRTPETRLLYGDPDTETTHREHGIVYHLDPSEVMFSSGNKTERHRLREHVEAGETLVDLFAGIGYFTLPLAEAGARVVACEVNPTAAGYLRRNVEANDLAERVQVREGDCREQAPTGGAQRVLMGYFPGTEAYLDTAVEALGPTGGWIHYHDAVERVHPLEQAEAKLRGHEALAGTTLAVEHARVVKTLDPRRVHVALDVHLER